MFRKILKWFKDRKEKKERELKFKTKLEEMRKRDPFTYKH